MVKSNGQIYITTNLLNNKVYIGQTHSNDRGYLGGGILIKSAIKKYGRKCFSKEILKTGLSSQEEIDAWERYYIKLYSSQLPEFGYNIRIGGENKGFKHNITSIEKISKRSQQTDNKQRIRNIQKLAANSRIGTHHSLDSKLKMLKNKFGIVKTIYIRNKENNQLIATCNFSPEASNITGVKRSAISNNLAGLSKSAGKYIFKYE